MSEKETHYTNMGNDTCPTCRKTLNAVTSIADKNYKPNPGDLTVCVYCLDLLKYEEDMELSSFPLLLFEMLDRETKEKIIQTQIVVANTIPAKSEELAQLRKKHAEELFSKLNE